jgi:hypothetical protein
MKAKIVWERPQNSKKKWYRVFATYISGVTEEIARFTYRGDVYLYIDQHFTHAGNTAEVVTVR